jgi:hypothetical protein
MGVRDWPDDQLFVNRRCIFEALLEPFIDGREYTWAEIEGRVWGPHVEEAEARPDARYLYRDGVFTEVVESSPHSLVPADSAPAAVEELLRQGLGMRDIAAAAGVSLGAAERAAAGHGFVRRATQDALLQAAASMSGSKPA